MRQQPSGRPPRIGTLPVSVMVEATPVDEVSVYPLKSTFLRVLDSFPSMHVSTTFAVGTVLAESGGDDYRWLRRGIGYGFAAATAYARLDSNAHWLSDTVAGAALGIATAQFAMQRRDQHMSRSAVMLIPVDGGAVLTYSLQLE